MQFNLTKTAAKLNSFNIRAEQHGEENVPAGDLRPYATWLAMA